jgi:hypothetical protein
MAPKAADARQGCRHRQIRALGNFADNRLEESSWLCVLLEQLSDVVPGNGGDQGTAPVACQVFKAVHGVSCEPSGGQEEPEVTAASHELALLKGMLFAHIGWMFDPAGTNQQMFVLMRRW